MATYIVLNHLTEKGIHDIKDTLNRAESARKLAREFGCTLKDIYWTLGEYDVVSVFDAPDEASMTALALAFGQGGNVRTEVMRAFTQDEMRGVLGKMSKAREAVPA